MVSGGFAARSAPPHDMAAQLAQLADDSSGVDWPATGRTYGEQHFSPLDQINDRNVNQLGLAWSMDLGFGNPATQPVAIGGVVYFSSGMSIVRAVDAVTGKLLWTFDPEIAKYAGKEMRQQWGARAGSPGGRARSTPARSMAG